MNSTKTLLMLSTALLSAQLGQAYPAMSQETKAAKAADNAIEEIVVTATRRGVTNIQTTPVAVTAITPMEIERIAPRDLGGLAWSVPNFSNGQTAGFNSASYSIRGVGQVSIIVYLDSPVGVVVDDFVVPHIQTQNLEMFDIEQVEVLRGPQGTLFGKNTTAGVINVRTKKPVLEETSVDARLSYGSFNKKEAKVALNLGLGDKVAFRVAGMYLKSDGYYRNNAAFGPVVTLDQFAPSQYTGLTGQGDGRRLGGDDVFSGRAKLLFQPTEDLSVLLQYEMVRDNGDTVPVYNDSVPGDLFPILGYPSPPGDPIKNVGITSRPGFPVDPEGQGHQVDIDGFYGNIDWDFGNYAIHSVTGYRDQVSRLSSTYTGEVGPVSLFDAIRDDTRHTFQQEVRITSNLDGPINFVAGGFYQSNDVVFCVVQTLGFVDLTLGDIGLDFNNNPQILCNSQNAKALAGYADATYDVNDRLHISGGYRYTYERKKWQGRNQMFISALGVTNDTLGDPLRLADFNQFPMGVVSDRKSWNDPSYRAVVSYDISDNAYSYISYSHSFKSGAYNDQTGTSGVPIPPLAAKPTNPEFATSYELGLKGNSPDESFRYSIATFLVNYSDAQRDTVSTIINAQGQQFQETRFFNAAKMTIKGFELEATWRPTRDWLLKGNVGYLHGNYKKFQIDSNFDGIIDVDFSNRPITKAPKLQLGLDSVYTYEVATGEIEFYGNVAYESSSIYAYSDLGPAFDAVLNKKTLLNASITYRDSQDRYFLRLIGKNLTDKRYKTGSLPVAALWVMTNYGEPRFFGVELGFKFSRE